MNELTQTIAELIQTIVVYALPVLFAITFHEAAHAYVAKFFGDTTAYSQGRMSLNPAKHIDLFGTIVLPLVLYIATSMPIGYAKPVPVEFGKLRRPKRDMVWVALAGPAANFLFAVVWLVIARIFDANGIQEQFFVQMARAGIWVNLIMFAFNLFPLPPLDGGRVLAGLLPHKYSYKFSQLEPYGMVLTMLLVMLNAMNFWMNPVVGAAHAILLFVASPINHFIY